VLGSGTGLSMTQRSIGLSAGEKETRSNSPCKTTWYDLSYQGRLGTKLANGFF
jgi:hypothetical protein